MTEKNDFYQLKLIDVRRETDDTVSLAFDVSNELKPVFQYIPGQYLTLKKYINGEDVRRSYSICSHNDEDLRVAIKKVPDGIFSTHANESLKVGDLLEVMPPKGHFFKKLDEKDVHHYVAFAAGSGITPIMSILKTTLSTEPESKFTLFYGNKQTDSIIFREELEQLKNTYMGRLSIHHVLSREDVGSDWFTGRIDGKKCKFYFDHMIDVKHVDAFFLCGPHGMILEVQDVLNEYKVEEDRIRTELFFVDADVVNRQKEEEKPEKRVPLGDSTIEVILDGQLSTFSMKTESESILDAASRIGLDLPYSCKGGVCSTCRAKIIEGEVELLINYALENDELAQGFVLTCQSLPKSKKIKVDFDA